MSAKDWGFYAWSKSKNTTSFKPFLDLKFKDKKDLSPTATIVINEYAGEHPFPENRKEAATRRGKSLFGIRRRETGGYCAWSVKFSKCIDKKDKVVLYKSFSDLKFGGKEEALVAAIKFRDEHAKEFYPSFDKLKDRPKKVKKEQEAFEFLPGEEWKQIKDFGGKFLVTSYGRIVSTYEFASCFTGSKILENGKRMPLKETVRIDKMKEMKPTAVYTNGQLSRYIIQFSDPVTRKRTNIGVAQLVAKAFLPNPLNRKKVRHKDRNLLNCGADNLEWKAGGCMFENKEEYIQHLKTADVGERKSEDVCNAIIEYLEGNTSKMEEVLGNNRTKIFRKIYWMVTDLPKAKNCSDLAEDLTQETLIRICEKIDNFMFWYPKNPVGWFIRIAQNVTRNYVARISGERLVEYNPDWGKHQPQARDDDGEDYYYYDDEEFGHAEADIDAIGEELRG